MLYHQTGNPVVFTGPFEGAYAIQSVHVQLITYGTAGTRQVVVEFLDDAGAVAAEARAGAMQAMNQMRNYQFSVSCPNFAAFVDTNFLMTTLPTLVGGRGHSLRVRDNAAISADDTFIVHIGLSRVDLQR